MDVKIDDMVNDFVIEDNILKGATTTFLYSYQVGQVILDVLKSDPDHVSQIDAATGKRMTFSEMRELSIRCGLWLRKQGIGNGDIVMLCTDNHLDTCIPFIATFLVEAIHSAWNHEITLAPARHLMKLFQPKVIFACESIVNVLLEAAKLENVDTKIVVFGQHPVVQSLSNIIQQQSAEDVHNFSPTVVKSPDVIGFIVQSSGSTGLPKGVVYSYGNIFKVAQVFVLKDISLWCSNHYWITCFGFTLRNILLRGTRIIPASSNPEDICRAIEKYKVQRMFASPVALTYLCKSNILDRYNLESLEMVLTSGSKVYPQVLQRLKDGMPQALIIQVYGMSEAGGCIVIQTKQCKNINSVGYVIPNNKIKIADLETGRALGPNQCGELRVKPQTTMLGYYKNPEATKEAYDEEGWLRSGDKAYYDENGEIFILDRLKDVMKYQNHQVSPSEIEQVLLGHPDILEVAVAPIPHDVDGDHPMAFVKKVTGSKLTEEELVELSSSLGDSKKLRGGVKFIDELPKTPSGKILRQDVKKMAKSLANDRNSKLY